MNGDERTTNELALGSLLSPTFRQPFPLYFTWSDGIAARLTVPVRIKLWKCSVDRLQCRWTMHENYELSQGFAICHDISIAFLVCFSCFSFLASPLPLLPSHCYFLPFLTRRCPEPNPKGSSRTVLGQSAAMETHSHYQTQLQVSSFFLQAVAQQLRHPGQVGAASSCEMRKFGYD